jgi:hypothetical protein
MTNGIKLGDQVLVPTTEFPFPLMGKVVEIDDHPFEYGELKLEIEGAAGTVHKWVSSRMARKV